VKLSYQESGQEHPTTLVFLHGLGVSGWMWTDQVEALRERYHCLNVDLPGNGESYRTEWLSFADTANQLADLIRSRAHGGKAHVIGLSLGGFSALHLLEHHPEVVHSTIVSGVTSRPFDRPGLWRAAVRLLSRSLRWGWVIWLSAKMMQLPGEAIPLYRRDSRRLSRTTIQRIYDEVLPYSLPASLDQRQTRVLAVAGDAEARKIRNDLSLFPELLPGSTVRLAPQAHHGWNAEHPELFTAMIEAWVSEEELPNELIAVGSPPESRKSEGMAA
jgi:pimeloyl-ACP methyl ester carboxylesterase